MAKHQSQKKREGKAGLKTGEAREEAWPGEVVEIIGSLGTARGGSQVRCKVLGGPDTGKIMRRNVQGPVRVGDVLMLKQTEIEAQALKGGRR